MKIKSSELSKQQRIETLDALYTTAAAVEGRESMKLFLRDLLTESERIMLGRRILIARKLLASEPYDDIAEELGVGRDTIWRVGRWLLDQMPGYEQAIEKLERELDKRQEKKLYATSSLYRLKKKYPLYFLLFPTPSVSVKAGAHYRRKSKYKK